jgi:UDP-galactopyranose mutase
VGCGFYGATIAQRARDLGKSVLIIDKREHIAGNAYTEKIHNINIHKYGAHIFHTSSGKIWNYINQFGKFNNYRHKVIADYNNCLYSLPFNMWTFNQVWGIKNPNEALEIINSQRFLGTPRNLEEQAISMVGYDIYNILIKGYTIKQWNKDPKDLPPSIIKRIPIRFSFNDDYFDDKYQGIPIEGYTKLIENMISGCDIELNSNYIDNRNYYDSLAKKIVYTGPVDQFFEYKYGNLEYRSLSFETEIIEQTNNFQGNSVVNYTNSDIPYTRILEHKHFDMIDSNKSTIITKEYPKNFNINNEPYYPINDDKNISIYNKYKIMKDNIKYKFLFGGRLAEYKYYDMHQVIGSALATEI